MTIWTAVGQVGAGVGTGVGVKVKAEVEAEAAAEIAKGPGMRQNTVGGIAPSVHRQMRARRKLTIAQGGYHGVIVARTVVILI